ncbi:putative protein phosphatase 2C 6 [Abeliophyllum distichum]|uniref:PPM-type phosphatase domain-containing protein n=1 Tax=Abeliophyllum distichum TaxID=126358 RepID=A0ABD1NSR0_9LAMI
MVARKVRDSLPLLLREEWKAKSNSEQISAGKNGNHAGMIRFDEFMDGDGFDSIEVDNNEKLPEMHMPLKRSILKAFKLMDKELKLHPTIDCFCSGTTAVTLIMQDQDLIIGNIDLKPNLPREAARIQKCMGRVFALQDEPEVARVWLPNSNSPGLAMARAFGDFCLKDFGLISIPDVYYHHITMGDEFVVLATDGVWDVLSNKEAVEIVASAPGRATAARALVDCATRAWRLKYPTSKNDDCAVVCLFLQQVSGTNVAKAQNNITIDSEVEMKVPKEGGTEGSNIDVVASLADLVHSDYVNESGPNVARAQNNITKDSEVEMTKVPKEGGTEGSNIDVVASCADLVVHSDNVKESSEIESVVEPLEKLPERILDQSKRSLAECLSTTEDEEWSALEGVTRVNSLLSLPSHFSQGLPPKTNLIAVKLTAQWLGLSAILFCVLESGQLPTSNLHPAIQRLELPTHEDMFRVHSNHPQAPGRNKGIYSKISKNSNETLNNKLN